MPRTKNLRMIPQMVYLEPIQEAGLRQLKLKQMNRISVSEIVREGVDMILKARGMRAFARDKK